MKKYFYFYDLNEILIDRYPAKISKEITKISNSHEFVFLYSEKYKYSSPQNIPDGSKYYFINDLSHKTLDRITKNYPPKSLTTIAQRIPDMWILTYFNHKNIPTFLVQHGLWSDRLERIPLIKLLLGKFKKFINYVSYTRFLCKKNSIPLIPSLNDLYRFLIKEDTDIPDTKYLHNDMLRAKKAFVYDKSWDEYYTVKYGYNINQLIYIGNPDFLLLKNQKLDQKEDAVCYVCQSFVEDGRLTKNNFEEFIKILADNVATHKKLYIKLHPRSRMEYYAAFENNPNVVFTNDLPICKYYIGHYSGLLAAVKQISVDILIWKLKDHYTPPYFLQYGSVVTNKESELRDFILGKIKSNNSSSIRKLTQKELDTFDPIKTIAENIIRYSKS